LIMSCKSIRAQIHDWMDLPSPGAMPDPIRDHIRDCPECHAFIKRWNAVEVGLVSMRNQAPALSTGFESALDSRLDATRQSPAAWSWVRRLVPPRQAKLALAGGSAALLVWLCYMVGAAVMASLSPRGAAGIAGSAEQRHVEPAPPIPAQIQHTPR
jgi:hypothetical protein